jgi:hypothetical protein
LPGNEALRVPGSILRRFVKPMPGCSTLISAFVWRANPGWRRLAARAGVAAFTMRARTQVSAAHSREDLEFAVNAFAEVNEELK